MSSRLKYQDIKQDVESIGWKLISTDYINLKTDLEILCPEGHSNFVSYEKFRKHNYECPICKSNPFITDDKSAVKKSGFRILAFDQASITSGWSVFDDNKLIKFGKWSSDGSHSTERIAQTKYWFASMINKWKPDLIVLEDIQLQKFDGNEMAVVTYKKLAHLQGVLKNYCYENSIPYSIVPPATWRAHSEIKGKTRTDKKKNAQLKIKKLYDVSATQDESDAILIGRWAAHQHSATKIVKF